MKKLLFILFNMVYVGCIAQPTNHLITDFYSYYASFDPNYQGVDYFLSINRLTASNAGGRGVVMCNIGCSSSFNPLTYIELHVNSGSFCIVGVCNHSQEINDNGTGAPFGTLGGDNNGWGYVYDGTSIHNAVQSAYGTNYGTGNDIAIALDMINGYAYFRLNGAWQNGATSLGISNGTGVGAAYSGLTGTLYFAISNFGGNASSYTANFGATTFTYTPPTGGTNTFTGLHH